MTTKDAKNIVFGVGADLCGIANVDRFMDAPQGFHPQDVLPSARSVIVFAKEFLASTLQSHSTIPYTIVRNLLSSEMDYMSVAICTQLSKEGIIALPTGTIGPSEYDTRTGRHRNIISAKHSAVLAGLGRIGRNTLLITPEYGNMVWICAIVCDAQLESDPLLKPYPCPEGCRLCRDACPVGALESEEMDQMACWQHAFGKVGEGDWRIRCFRCRAACPLCIGDKNRSL